MNSILFLLKKNFPRESPTSFVRNNLMVTDPVVGNANQKMLSVNRLPALPVQ